MNKCKNEKVDQYKMNIKSIKSLKLNNKYKMNMKY